MAHFTNKDEQNLDYINVKQEIYFLSSFLVSFIF